MEAASRQPADRLKDSLLEDPYAFDFLHGMRLIRWMFPDAPEPGSALRPNQEPYRLHQRVDLRFAPASFHGIEWDEESGQLRLLVYFLGLCGPNGPLPTAWSEFVLERRRQFGDDTLESFLNIFNHRILSLFFKAWMLNQPAVDYERGEDSRFSRLIRSLIGIGTVGLSHRDAVNDNAKLFFSGHLRSLSRSAEGLASILSGFFEMPARIEEFQGQWLLLPDDSLCRLGASEETGLLGSSVIVGSKVWEYQLKFRIVFGPLTLAEFQRLLPQGEGFQRLRSWVNLYLGYTFDWEVQLILRADEVQPMQLGSNALLGWTTWSLSGSESADRSDLLLQGN